MSRFPAKRKIVLTGPALVPTTQDGRDEIEKIDLDQEVMISLTKARNVRQFNLFWKLCELLAQNFDMTKENVKAELCEKVGHVEPVFYHNGSMRLRPKSISFENMPQEEFARFFQLVTVAAAQMLGSAPDDVIKRVNELLDPHYPRSAA